MGNLCPCFQATKPTQDQCSNQKTISEPLVSTENNEASEKRADSDEWDMFQLTRKNTKVIEIRPDEEFDNSGGSKERKKINVEDFQFHKVLGKGSFGKVVLVEKRDTGKLYAMKVLQKDAIEKRNQKFNTKAEREILQKMKSQFIVQLHYAFQTPEKLYLVMDFMQGGELFFHLRKAIKFNEQRTQFHAAEIILALEYLHSKGIIYRDLKPENILLDAEGHIKITDFGLSKAGVAMGSKAYTFCGTPEYLAPEILQGLGHDYTADWWSLGALIYEMASGAPPFYSKDKTQMFKNILEKPIEMRSYFSKELCSLLKGLLVLQPSKRLQNAREIKSQEFFRTIDWDKLARRELLSPFRPIVENANDLRNFDKQFTEESMKETPDMINKSGLSSNTYFNFSYNPDYDLKRSGQIE